MEFDQLERREFITLLGGAGVAWPLAVHAQQTSRIARIGFLGATSADGYARQVEGFRLGLRELGYMEGTNVLIAYRWAQGNYERLPELAVELIRSNVDVIVTHGTPGSFAAKQASATVPIVMAIHGDPVGSGLVASLSRPGGNITGSSFFGPELAAKRIELLKEMLPPITRVAALENSNNPYSRRVEIPALETTARSLGIAVSVFSVRSPNELESAFGKMQQEDMQAVAVEDEGMLNSNIAPIAVLAARHKLLSIGNNEFARAGGLIGYGVNFFEIFRRAASFVDKVLKGAKPADIPIEQATRFQFVLNLKTANALGLDMPTSMLLRADEVIE